ncbi:DUF6527 family protein [Geothrix sp. 21YS21S-2]|uniref:DUF6527 family protein n=1 Tax=Geothrix sp. 21YS21S-2 TaxID=3068893 RepID=UPI00358F19CD
MRFATASHKCCCGCGNVVVTPIRPTDWTLIFDGRGVSLYPSIGNWGFKCQSHYWIRCNQVVWAQRMSPSAIVEGREHDRQAKEAFFMDLSAEAAAGRPGARKQKRGLWQKLKEWANGS